MANIEKVMNDVITGALWYKIVIVLFSQQRRLE